MIRKATILAAAAALAVGIANLSIAAAPASAASSVKAAPGYTDRTDGAYQGLLVACGHLVFCSRATA
ncbi:MAG: hypothetical protein ACRDOL_17790, partial [Streptosporangiaceae bacterium]